MVYLLGDNIRENRKERGLTQTQLAEILGVTAGAVYKWESGLSVPELDMIVELADFFDVSVDALLGYRLRDKGPEAAMKRIAAAARARDPAALEEAERALKKHPNSFSLVHACAEVYAAFGAGDRDPAKLRRARELLEQSRLLIAQNRDPKISDLTICGELASVYLLLGEHEKGVEMLKQHNAGGLFSDTIGISLAVDLKRPEEAVPYLSEALIGSVETFINAVFGYALVFCSRDDIDSAQEILDWCATLLRGLKPENSPGFMDKVFVMLDILRAHTQAKKGNTEEARASMRTARAIARRFDAAPDYSVGGLCFAALPEGACSYDSLGATAAGSAERLLGIIGDPATEALWKELNENE